jgi:hypothetical protein
LAEAAAIACENFAPTPASCAQFFTDANECVFTLLEPPLPVPAPLPLEVVVAAAVVAAAVVVVVPEAAAFDAVFLLPQPAAKIATASRSRSEPALNLIFDLPLSTGLSPPPSTALRRS